MYKMDYIASEPSTGPTCTARKPTAVWWRHEDFSLVGFCAVSSSLHLTGGFDEVVAQP